MTDVPLDDRYFEWLYSQIGSVRNRNPARSYWKLFRQLYSKEFIWLVANDDNRVEDGRELRYEFLDQQESDEVEPGWLDLGCSMLEMLIALSRRAAFESDAKQPVDWFWAFLNNCGLGGLTDKEFTPDTRNYVEEVLDRIIFRTYHPNGKGGLFPLHHPVRDQRKVELWYQLAAYLLEEFPP